MLPLQVSSLLVLVAFVRNYLVSTNSCNILRYRCYIKIHTLIPRSILIILV